MDASEDVLNPSDPQAAIKTPSQGSSFDFQAMDDASAQERLAENGIALNLIEARKIQDLLKRPPTLSECILWGIQGSEHCAYKSSRIHLKQLTTDGPNVVLGAKEDAGVVHLAKDKTGKSYCLAISHESHNHPSQVVPFEGAATGIGGNIRDISCMGATVIANADSLRFGDPKRNQSAWIQQGVVAGIASYSNAIGVPNITGDVAYHSGYNDNCLVTVVSLGIVEQAAITHSYAPKNADGHNLILVGKPTDQSGFGGASFASADLEEDSEANIKAVQEPNAFLGRMLLKANADLCERLKAQGLIDQVGFKDLGAGGIACASVELAEAADMGADVILNQVHTSIEDLNPAVILCAETQERYMWVCPPELTESILQHYNERFDLPNISEGSGAVVVGKIVDGGQYRVRYQGEILIDAKAKDITEGIVYDRPTEAPKRQKPKQPKQRLSLAESWQALIKDPNCQNDKPIYQHYDKQVQGRTIIERGQADAGLLQPFNNDDYPKEIQHIGVALSVAANPHLGRLDPHYCAQHAVITAMNRVAAIGAEPWAMTDCLCFGNPEDPEQMWDFVQSVQGLKLACETITLKAYPNSPTPIVAGNVSLYNQSKQGAIPASPMISCTGRIEDVRHAIGPRISASQLHLIALGERLTSLGGSVLAQYSQVANAELPVLDLKGARAQIVALTDAIEQRLVAAAKTIEMGGLAWSIKRMAFGSDFGADLNDIDQEALFSEAPGFVLAVPDNNIGPLEALLNEQGVIFSHIGNTTNTQQLSVNGQTLELGGPDA